MDFDPVFMQKLRDEVLMVLNNAISSEVLLHDEERFEAARSARREVLNLYPPKQKREYRRYSRLLLKTPAVEGV